MAELFRLVQYSNLHNLPRYNHGEEWRALIEAHFMCIIPNRHYANGSYRSIVRTWGKHTDVSHKNPGVKHETCSNINLQMNMNCIPMTCPFQATQGSWLMNRAGCANSTLLPEFVRYDYVHIYIYIYIMYNILYVYIYIHTYIHIYIYTYLINLMWANTSRTG